MKLLRSLPIIAITCQRITDEPTSYCGRAMWAEQMLKTHHCGRCPKCGLFTMWYQKPTLANEAKRLGVKRNEHAVDVLTGKRCTID